MNVTALHTPLNTTQAQAVRYPQQGVAFGNAGVFTTLMQPVNMFMGPINRNKLVELVATDFIGFVAPRTYIDTSQRGADAGREVFLREMMGTLTNTYMCGWMMYPLMVLLQHPRINTKAMSLSAWVDTKMLGHFSAVANQVLNTSKTAEDIPRHFLNYALTNIESSDSIHSLPEFKDMFPGKGKLAKPVRERLVNEYLRRRGQYSTLQAHPNIDLEVSNFMRNAVSNQALRDQIKNEAEEQFLSVRGLQQQYQMTPRQQKRYHEFLRERLNDIKSAQSRVARQLHTKAIRRSEVLFIDYLKNLAVQEGGLTDKIMLTEANGKPMADMGVRTLEGYLYKVKYFMEEFLQPALMNREEPMQGELTTAMRRSIRNRLFKESKGNFFQRYIIPQTEEGLIPYVIKMKRPLIYIPLLLTVAVGAGFVWVNNWITRSRYHGKDFFPGEGLPEELKLNEHEG